MAKLSSKAAHLLGRRMTEKQAAALSGAMKHQGSGSHYAPVSKTAPKGKK